MSNLGKHPHRRWFQANNPTKSDFEAANFGTNEQRFYYFAYGSCMSPIDLERSLGEDMHPYLVGAGTLKGYRLGYYRYSNYRKGGVLDVVKDTKCTVHGVLYHLPWRLSKYLDMREDVPRGGYRQEDVDIHSNGKIFVGVRTYVVVNKLPEEIAPSDKYFNIVLQGAISCGLPDEYCWSLSKHVEQLHQKQQKLAG